MSFTGLTGAGNFHNHWTSKEAFKFLVEQEGYTSDEIKNLKPKELISYASGADIFKVKDIQIKYNLRDKN